MKLIRVLVITLLILIVLSFYPLAFSEVQLDDGNGYFKFTELDKAQVMKYGGPSKLIEGKDRILCFENFGYEYDPHREVRYAGFWDENYQQIYNPNWKRIAGFYNGIAKVEDENGKAIFIDTKGNVVLKTDYDYNQCGNYQEGLISVVLEPYNQEKYWGKCGYIDISGKVVLKGFIDKEGNFVGEPAHINIRDYAEDIRIHDMSIGYNMVNDFPVSEYLADELTGERISDTDFYYLKRLSRDLFYFKRDQYDYGGFINKDGKIILESQHSIIPGSAVPDFPRMAHDSTMAKLAFVNVKRDNEPVSKLHCYDSEGKKIFENYFSVLNAGYTTDNFMLVETYEYRNVAGTQMTVLNFDNSKVYIVEVNK